MKNFLISSHFIVHSLDCSISREIPPRHSSKETKSSKHRATSIPALFTTRNTKIYYTLYIYIYILHHIIQRYSLIHSYYPTPLPAQFTSQFCSLYPRDQIFGSVGPVHQHQWEGKGFAHQPTQELALQAVHWARIAARHSPESLTILLITKTQWLDMHHPNLDEHTDVQLIAYFSHSQQRYAPTPTFPHIHGQNRTLSNVDNMCTSTKLPLLSYTGTYPYSSNTSTTKLAPPIGTWEKHLTCRSWWSPCYA